MALILCFLVDRPVWCHREPGVVHLENPVQHCDPAGVLEAKRLGVRTLLLVPLKLRDQIVCTQVHVVGLVHVRLDILDIPNVPRSCTLYLRRRSSWRRGRVRGSWRRGRVRFHNARSVGACSWGAGWLTDRSSRSTPELLFNLRDHPSTCSVPSVPARVLSPPFNLPYSNRSGSRPQICT